MEFVKNSRALTFFVMSLIISISALTLAPQAAQADSLSVDFESYTTGNINGQNGWTKTGGYDVEVVESPVLSGSKSLRFSNAVTSGSFGDQTFSASLADEAGDAQAVNGGQSGGTRQNHFEAEFKIKAATSTYQPGLFLSVSPDRGDGARMSYLGFADTADGIDVTFYDVQSVVDPAVFTPTLVADNLSREAAHTAKLVIDFVDGPSNDIVKIYLDGNLVHTGTTWENYFRFDNESNPSLADESRTVDSLLFRAGGTAAPATQGLGFLIDDITLSSSIVSGEHDSVEIDVNDNTSAGENQLGWMFNRDTTTATPFQFNDDAASVGTGSLYVLPIGTTTPADKFIGELFLLDKIADIDRISYDFKIAAPSADVEEHFYMSVYANFGVSSSTKFYDCRYNVIPTAGSLAGFTTVTFDPTQSYAVTTRGGAQASPFTCPSNPAGMNALSSGSTIRAIALNVGDTSASDADVSGYLDNVKVVTKDGIDTHTTTYDFEPIPLAVVEDTIVVTNSDLKGWNITTAASGTAQFVLNGTAPLGEGNLNMATSDANADRVRATKEVSVLLADLGKELSYQTRQNESHCGGCSTAAYRIHFDADGNLETTGDTAELVYEPYWQNDKLGDPAPVTPDVWQTWDVDAGFFWAGIPAANQPNLPALTNGAGGPPFYTLADIEGFYPNAVVYAISVGIGTYNPTNDIDVDAVAFSYVTDTDHIITTYDFEPNLAPEAYDMTVLIPFNLGGIFNLAADDAEDDALTASIVDAAGHGTAETVSGIKVGYTPTLGFFGYDSFTFKVNDGTSDSNTATVDIIVYKDPTCPEGGSFIGGGSGNCMKMVDTVVAGVTVKLPEFYTASCPAGSTLVKPHDACEADEEAPGTPDEADNIFTIEATAGENGSITPNGTVTVVSGTDKTFFIVADAGYVVDDVLVDDESVGAVTEYEFTDVDEEHTIHAIFKIAPEGDEEETSGNNPPTSSRGGGGGGGGGSYIPPVPQVLGASTTACFQFTRNLSFGMSGADVLELQKALAAKGFMTATPNGNFGPATQAAVIAFQKANGLEQVGMAGPKTRALLNVCAGANPNQALIDELTKKLNALLAQIQQLLAARGQQ